MALSFPYPPLASQKRTKGKGCLSCVHKMYCPAIYWFWRYNQDEIDAYNGIQCGSWSDNSSEMIHGWTQDDIDENARLCREGILMEAKRNGITDPVTGSARNANYF